MALFEDALGGLGGGLAIGVGVALVVPALVAGSGSILAPVTKAAVRGVLTLTDMVRSASSELIEQVSDMVAEVRAESATGQRSRRAGAHH